jgi:hypothetical protein
MLCSPDTRRNARILHDEYPVILDALILHIFRKLDCMQDARIQPIKYFIFDVTLSVHQHRAS